MPKYLYVRRYFTFTILAIFTIIVNAALLGLSLYVVYQLGNIPPGKFFNFPLILGPTLGSISTSVFVLMIAKLIKNYAQSEEKNKSLEHEKTENELKFLKSQLNPHFLFNALNNIYFLIKKDPDTAAESLAKFSDMVRYQLYECNEDKILLSQELDYINNYVKITSLGKVEITDINVRIEEDINNLKISPLILVPLVENAFKHVGENAAGENFINIDIGISDNKLICTTENSVDKTTMSKTHLEDSKKEGGLGLPNLQRRLSLLYSNKHRLEIEEKERSYFSKLELEL